MRMKEEMNNFEKELIKFFMEQTHENITESARIAGIDRSSFWRLMRKHNIVRKEARVKAPKEKE